MEDYRNKTKKVQIGNVCIGGGGGARGPGRLLPFGDVTGPRNILET